MATTQITKNGVTKDIHDRRLINLTADVTELNFCDGVTSNIQTQLNNKQNTLTAGSNIQINDSTISATDTTYSTGTDSTAGITKLYSNAGENADGAYTQQAINNYIVSRGENLITNGFGNLLSSYNFVIQAFNTPMTYVTNDGYNSCGCFEGGTTTCRTNEYMPIDASRDYLLTFAYKSPDGQQTTGQNLVYVDMYDIDKYSIVDVCVNKQPNTLTTLTQDLNPGDTVLHATNLENWKTGTTVYANQIAVYNYHNSYNQEYSNYTRNLIGNPLSGGQIGGTGGAYFVPSTDIDKTNNTITFSQRAWNGVKIPAGTKIAQPMGGGYIYIVTGYKAPDAEWHVQQAPLTNSKIRPGTAFVRIAWYPTGLNTTRFRIAAVSWTANAQLVTKTENNEIFGYVDNAWKRMSFPTISNSGNYTLINQGGTLGWSLGYAAQSNKGSATKVPQISTNKYGHVTNITEIDIAKTTLTDLGITATATELNYSDGVTSNIQTQLNAKQPTITSSTDLTCRLLTGGITYTTTAPTAANTDGVKIAILSSAPATKYDGWLYFIAGA